jgi:hypothetical protein
VEYKIFGPGGSPPEDFHQDLEAVETLDDPQRDAIAEWFLTTKSYDPYASPLPANIIASTLVPDAFQDAVESLSHLLWAWEEYGLELNDIERDLLLLGVDSDSLRGMILLLGRLSTVKGKVWGWSYALAQLVEGLPTIDAVNFICEARAVFGGYATNEPVSDSYRRFLGIMPIVIMELISSDNHENQQRLAVQLSKEKFEWLRNSIERAHEQLSIMKERTASVAFNGNGLE